MINILKIETMVDPWNNATAGDYFKEDTHYYVNKAGTHAFNIVEYKRAQE